MATVLVVDDSAVDRRLAGGILEKQAGLRASYAADGREALAAIRQDSPDIVLADVQMPHLDGLQLVKEIARSHPNVPVVLMTAHGSEDIALEALRTGAAGYVPKKHLHTDLARTVQDLLGTLQARRQHQMAIDCWVQTESLFTLGSDPAVIPSLIGLLQENLKVRRFCNETGLIQVAVALREALVHVLYHGNLEIDPGLRDQDELAYHSVVAQRLKEEPYASRQVRLTVEETRSEAVYHFEHDGPGFDPSRLQEPAEAEQMGRVGGRGLLLMRTFMDEVQANETGTELTLVKRREW